MSNSLQINQLRESLEPVWAIYCDHCSNTLDEKTNYPDDFARTMYGAGWRVSDDGEVPAQHALKPRIAN